ncbi:MAG: leucine-rich repeat domain-containing protein [Candidatus Thorarchaeota archaeon]
MSDQDLNEIFYYEFIKGTSSKFWEITIKGNTFSTRYGRIGTVGRKTTKIWESFENCMEEATKLCKSKEKKGYILKSTKKIEEEDSLIQNGEEEAFIFLGDEKYNVKDGYLNLSSKKILEIPEIKGLSKIIDLKSLDLSDNYIDNIAGLDALINLKKLNLSNNLITEIKGLENLKSLEELIIGGRDKAEFGISKIEGLENLRNLKNLCISVKVLDKINGLDDLENLEELSIIKHGYLSKSESCQVIGLSKNQKLKKIILKGIKIRNLETLKDVDNIEELRVVNCGLSEIKGLSKLKKLKILDVSENSIKNINDLELPKNLYELNASRCSIKEINPMKNNEILKVLRLPINGISSIEDLKSFKELSIVDVHSNHIKSLKGLENLHQLEDLNLSFNENLLVRDEFKNLINLKKLDLERTRLKSIENLKYLKNLDELNLDSNYIESFKPLNNLLNIRVLSIRDNRIYEPHDATSPASKIFAKYKRIYDLSEFKSLKSLEALSLRRNEIIDVYDLENIPKLKHLDISANFKLNINSIEKLITLEKLNLRSCKISDITVLKNLVNLREIHLENNEISNFEPLINLRKIEKIYLDENQLSSNIDQLNKLGLTEFIPKQKRQEPNIEKDLKIQRKLKDKKDEEAKHLTKKTLRDIETYFKKNYPNPDFIEEINDVITTSQKFNHSTYSSFPDYFDYALFNLRECLSLEKFENPNYAGNPNRIVKELDEALSYVYSTHSLEPGILKIDDLIACYPKRFINNARKWMLSNLKYFFLEDFAEKHIKKLTPNTVEKLVDAGVKSLLISCFLMTYENGGAGENEIKMLEPRFLEFKNINLNYQDYIDKF